MRNIRLNDLNIRYTWALKFMTCMVNPTIVSIHSNKSKSIVTSMICAINQRLPFYNPSGNLTPELTTVNRLRPFPLLSSVVRVS